MSKKIFDTDHLGSVGASAPTIHALDLCPKIADPLPRLTPDSQSPFRFIGSVETETAKSLRATPLPKTILLVHDGHGRLRGSEAVVFSLLDGIDRDLYRWIVLTNHPEFAAGCHARGIAAEVRPFRMLMTEGFRLRDLADLLRFSVMGTRLIRAGHVSLVHLSNGGACSWMVPAAWLAGVPVLVHLHTHWSRKMRLVLGLHFADRIVGVCRSVIAGFRIDPVATRRMQVVYNGFDELSAPPQDRLVARAEFGFSADTIVIAQVAVLIEIKRVDIAIEAMRQLPPDLAPRARLLVIGDGPERLALERQAAGLPIIFTGHRTDVHHLMRNVVDVVILPSQTEAFSVVLLEAAAAGVARIGSDVGGIGESIRDNWDGLLVPAQDAGALAAALTTLGRDPAARRKYGAAARQRLRSEFSTKGFLAAFTAIYDEMSGQPAPRRLPKLASVIRSVWFQCTARRRPQADPRPNPATGGLDQMLDRITDATAARPGAPSEALGPSPAARL